MACSVRETITRDLKEKNFIDDKMNIIGSAGNVLPYIDSLNTYARSTFGVQSDILSTQSIKNKAGTFVKVNINPDIVSQIDTFKEQQNVLSSREDVEDSEVSFEDIQTKFGNEESSIPLGDNYVEFLNYKRDQLGLIDRSLAEISVSDKTGGDKVKNTKRRRDLNDRKKILTSQIELLEKNEVPLMFRVMFDDIELMNKALRDDSELRSIDDIKKKIDFLSSFVLGENEVYTAGSLREYGLTEDFNKLLSEITILKKDYTDLLRDKVIQMLEDSQEVQETLAKTGYTTKELLTANSDLSWADANFLGIMSSNTGDTVLPQFLQILMHRTQLRHSYTVDDLIDNLARVEAKTGLYNPEWVFGYDSKGESNGFVNDLYTDQWYGSLRNLGNLVRDYIQADGKGKKNTHQAVMAWFADNAQVIDFTKIPQIRQTYLGNPNYDKYFEGSTDEDAVAYDTQKRKEYGPKYDDIVHNIVQKLEVFENDRTDPDTNNLYLAQRNLWELLHNFKNPKIKSKHIIKSGEDVAFFNDFYAIPIVPKNTTKSVDITLEGIQEVEKDSGYINQDFRDTVLSNEDNLEYFNTVKALSEYINNTYQTNTTGRLSYPKVRNSWFESMHDNIKDIKSGKLSGFKGIASESLDSWKALAYEQGSYRQKDSDVHANYADRSKTEIKELARLYRSQGVNSEEAYKRASEKVLKDYSKDLSRDLKAVAQMAALHNARVEIAPVADAVLDTYKEIQDDKGNERKRGIARLEYYVDHIIYNNVNKYRDSNKLEGKSWNPAFKDILDVTSGLTRGKVNEKSLHYLSDTEKELFAGYKELLDKGTIPESITINDLDYKLSKRNIATTEGGTLTIFEDHGEKITQEQFDSKYREYLQAKIEKLGLDINLAGAIDGVLRTVILKSLALNPVSGIFNRIEGLNSSYIMDSTGQYWTPGNIDIAKQMMSWWNLKKMSFGKLNLADKNKAKQMRIFELLLRKMPGVLQDRKNELQRNVSESQIDIENFNVFKAAVDHPESKNQGSIILAKMMDFQLKDSAGNVMLDTDGNPITLVNKNTQEFEGFEIDEDGLLVPKPGFEHLDNVSSLEDLIIDMSVAVSRSQGNYSTNDIMLAKKTIWGRAGTMFMTWLPEHLNQRFGVSDQGQIDLYRRDTKADGRFVAGIKANKYNAGTMMLAGLGISYGMLGTVGLFGAGLVGAWVYKKYLGKYTNKNDIQREVNHIQEFTQMLLSLGIEFMNYPAHLLSSVPGVSKIKGILPKNNTFKNTTMNDGEIRAMQGMTRELAVMLSWLSFKMAVMALYKGIGGDDDDDKSPRRMKYYFIQNQLSRSITSLNGFTNPYAFIKDNSRNSFLTEMTNISKLMYSAATLDWDGVQDNITAPIPIPKMLDQTIRSVVGDKEAIYENKIDYSSQVDFNKIPAPLRWTSELAKDYFTEGEYSSKKAYGEARKEIRDKVQKEVIDQYGSDKEVVKQITDKKMRELVGSKYKELDYDDATEMIENEEVIKDPKKKASKADRNKFKDKLKEQGLSNSEIAEVMANEFRGR